MTDTLVDANVLIDIWSVPSRWTDWSIDAVAAARRSGELVINPIVLAEVSIPFETEAQVDRVASARLFRRDPLPWEASFRAAKAFVEYRKRGGARTTPLPDFFIGAHAATRGLRLLTRDGRRYATYFPGLELVTPESHP